MNMKNKLTLLTYLGLLFFTAPLCAQGVMEFDKETHDFGEVVEGELASHTFTFTNTGNAPIVVSGVRASCGCTTPYWTKDPVKPGEQGSVKATYNSKGRPGAFRKTITITSNGKPPRKMVYIKGTVVRKKKTYSAEEKKLSPRLVIESPKSFNVGKLEKGQSAEIEVLVNNEGVKDLEVNTIQSSCRCVGFNSSKPSIPKGESAKITLIYTPRSVGNQLEKVVLKSNDIVSGKKEVVIRANVVERHQRSSIMEGQKKNPFK